MAYYRNPRSIVIAAFLFISLLIYYLGLVFIILWTFPCPLRISGSRRLWLTLKYQCFEKFGLFLFSFEVY